MIQKPNWMLPNVDELTEFPAQDIARQLGALCRYAGATPHHYSVGRHSLLVVSMLPNDPALHLAGLLHDAHECWTGDVLRPASVRFKMALTDLQHEIDRKLWALAGIDPDPIDLRYVQQADDTACKLEMKLLGKSRKEIEAAMPGLKDAWFNLYFQGAPTIDALHWMMCYGDLKRGIE